MVDIGSQEEPLLFTGISFVLVYKKGILTMPSNTGSAASTMAVKNNDMIFGGLLGSDLKM